MLCDEKGVETEFEFLGLVLLGGKSYGFFFPVDDECKPLSSGEVVVLEVVEVDEEGQPTSFELVEDDSVALDAYREFQKATKDLYRFE